MNGPAHLGLIELALFSGFAILFGVWQLISVNRTIRDRKRAEQDEPPPD